MLADLEVVLSDDAGAAADRAAQLDALAPRDDRRATSDATFAGTPAALADRLIEQAGDGVHGFRLHPAVIADDLPPIARRLTDELRRRGVRPPGGVRPSSLRARLGLHRPANRYAVERPMSGPRQIHLAAHFPGVNNTTVWSDPAGGSHIDFSSFEQLARTAERAKFDFFFLAEGLRMREHAGRLHELDVAGRPDSLAILASLAAVTERIGLMATITTTYHEPYELARQLGTLDHLSDGRAGWNLVTSSDPFTGANFRRGGYLPYDKRYERGEQFVESVQLLWDAWAAATGRDSPTTAARSRSPASSRCRRCRRGARR